MTFDGLLKWRCIGPFRGGRVVAVAGDVEDRNTFYFGACAGGVWKTVDAGTYWECVSDGFFETSSVGALAVSEADPNVVFAGMGETTIRIDVSHGDGVYKSTDAGRTWRHMGLADTRHIAKIRIHPTNPDDVWVAAFGHAFGEHKDRGVYKSVDGGEIWKRVLTKNKKVGAIDLTLDPSNPRILYAAMWEAYRNFWQISSGGEGSGLYRSSDGGDTWTEITRNPGLPGGLLGKIGVTVSPARPGRVWALVENREAGGLYRSDDGGDTWEQISSDQRLVSRAWYYVHLTADPQDPDTVYVNNLAFWKSTDAGRTFTQIRTPHGDNHDLWIDPNDPQRMVQGNDGGANVSLTGGASWSSIYNQPTAQFYHLETDSRTPYRVYGTQQDNSSVSVPSRSHNPSIAWGDCYIAGTGESGYIAPHPTNPDIVYVGAIGSAPGGGNCLERYDHKRGQIRLVTTWPEFTVGQGAGEYRYRFAWTYPLFFSPHDPNTLYIGGNRVFRSTDEGQSWVPVSPDLTKADPETLLPSGGPVNREALGAETYATVFALAESPLEQDLLWAGSDDGLVHLSRDGGESWTDVTPEGLPERALVSMLEPSPHAPGTCTLAATRYKLDDYQPYLFRTTDHGSSWTRVDGGIRRDHFTRAVREDPNREGLLFAGTECGLYLSFDAGGSWERFQLNLPVTPIHDLKIKDGDLVAATHGRSFWILDDITPLHGFDAAQLKDDAHLFAPRASARILPRLFLGAYGAKVTEKTPEGWDEVTYLDTGANPPRGAVIGYHLRKRPRGEVTLTIGDADGNPIRTFHNRTDEEKAERKDDPHAEVGITADKGFNRFLWDMRHPRVTAIRGDDVAAETVIQGAMVPPGSYQVTLAVGGKRWTRSFTIHVDPTAGRVLKRDLQAQYRLWRTITDRTEEVVGAVNRMRDLREQLGGWSRRASGEAAAQATELNEKVLALESRLTVPDRRPGWTDTNNAGARLLDKLTALIPVVSVGDYRPTDQAEEAIEDIAGRIDEVLSAIDELIGGDLRALNDRLDADGTPRIVPG